MKHNFPYRKTYLKNLLASLLVVITLILLAFLSVQNGKNAILRKQDLAFREWNSAYSLLMKKPEFLKNTRNLIPMEEKLKPEAFMDGIPNTRQAQRFQRKYDSLAMSMMADKAAYDDKLLIELENSFRQSVQRYNQLVRQSNHFMKAFPNNLYSAIFQIPSLPEYLSDTILLNNISNN